MALMIVKLGACERRSIHAALSIAYLDNANIYIPRTVTHLIQQCLPDPDKYPLCGTKIVKDRIMIVLVLDSLAPSPLNVMHILSPG